MGYRRTSKAKKVWSAQALEKQARNRLARGAAPLEPDFDSSIYITAERPGLGEAANFKLLEGDRINNYSVFCNGKYLGVMGITRVMEGIRKALPAFRRMSQ